METAISRGNDLRPCRDRRWCGHLRVGGLRGVVPKSPHPEVAIVVTIRIVQRECSASTIVPHPASTLGVQPEPATRA